MAGPSGWTSCSHALIRCRDVSEDVRDITAADLGWVHPLNQDHAKDLSSLTREEMERMIAEAAYARLIAPDCAFLLAFDRTAAYDSPNFLWFCDRYEQFLYIDRIAVGAHARRRGLAAKLYADIFSFARAKGYLQIVAEINADPPNPGSDAFHEAQGFLTVGHQHLTERGKSVRYVARELIET